LISADLSIANLSDANLSSADLSSANLSGANLSGADLKGVNLSETKLGSATVKNTKFGGNLGLTEETRLDLIRRGAIFEEAASHRSRMLTVRVPRRSTALN
jgi:uncharacterized protein YjbI with pentapeptide repeats